MAKPKSKPKPAYPGPRASPAPPVLHRVPTIVALGEVSGTFAPGEHRIPLGRAPTDPARAWARASVDSFRLLRFVKEPGDYAIVACESAGPVEATVQIVEQV